MNRDLWLPDQAYKIEFGAISAKTNHSALGGCKMKSKPIIAMAISLIAYQCIGSQGLASASSAGSSPAGNAQASNLFSSEELDNLLAPIALFPDPLLAQILPASTFADQVTQAAQWLRANNDPSQIDDQQWDVSVKAVAHYPEILYKMSDQPDWTTALGQAFVAQSNDVSTSIQRLRTQARNAGSLVSTPQQTVAMDNGAVTIVPAQPSVIYVPTYDPYYVFAPSTGAIVASSLISFGAGFAIGAWLNRGWNWWGGGPYYHGWVGGGWIGAARPYVNLRNTAYVGNRFNNINVNNNVLNRNINAGNLNRFNTVHRNTNWANTVGGRHARPAPGNMTGRPGSPSTLPGRIGTPGMRPGNPVGRPGTPGARPAAPLTRPANPGTSMTRPTANPGGMNRPNFGGARAAGHGNMSGGARRGGRRH